MGELYRPTPEELFKHPRDLDTLVRERYHEQGFEDLREVLPNTLQESLDDARESVEQALEEQFGIPEVPPQLQAEMGHVIRAIAEKVREGHFLSEPDDAIYGQIERVAAKTLVFKEDVQDTGIDVVPEKGQVLWYVDAQGQEHERALTRDEQDMLFNMQMWADQLVSFQNVQQFQATLGKLQKRSSTKPESERQPYIEREMFRVYTKFGFTKEQIRNLLLLADESELPQLTPEGKPQTTQRLRVMKEVWDEYLSDGEKSSYAKFAVAMTGIGAIEGLGPALLGRAMDSKENLAAAALALGYLGLNLSAGWVRRKLNVGFDQFINQLTERQGGLNERLSQDLVFQPGERMSRGEDRGRILSSVRRSQSAFKDILYSGARVHLPAAAATTVGLGAMLAMDWRLGLMSLATAPIAVAIARRADKRIRPIVGKTYENEDKLAQAIQEQLQAHPEIVLSGMRDEMAGRVEGIAGDMNALEHERLKARSDMEFQAGYALGSSVIAGLTVAGVLLRNLGIEHGGDIVAALIYSGQFRRGFEDILRSNNDLIKSVEAIMEMEEVFNGYARDEQARDKDRVGASSLRDFAIDVSGVSLEIDGEKIIDNVSFKVPAGGVVRLEGRSGQGKTTISRLLSGYYRPTSGEVTIGGVDASDIKKTGPDSLYKHMAYLSQQPYIFDSGDLQANLRFGNPDSTDEELSGVLIELGLAKRFTKDGVLDLSSSIRGLSGGEKARLGLARVLLKIRSQENGGIVFLDQATEELDEETEAEVAHILLAEKKARPDTTFIIISHRSEFIRLLEHPDNGKKGFEVQCVRLKEGKLVTDS